MFQGVSQNKKVKVMSASRITIFKSIGSFPIKCINNKNKNQYYDLQVKIEPSS